MRAAVDTDGSIGRVAAGIGLFALSIFLFSCMDALIKWLSSDFPTIQIVFFRVSFALIPIAILVIGSGGARSLRTQRPLMHIGRGMIGFGAAFSFFLAFAHMPLADAYAIAFAAPLMITAMSALFLGEQVGWRSWSAVGVGFIGVLIILRPGGDASTLLSFGAAVALLGTLLYATNVVLIRHMVDTESNAAILAYQTLTSMALSGLFLPWHFHPPTWPELLLLAGVGILGGSATLAMTHSFRMVKVSILAPFEYTAMVWGVLFGIAIWGDIPHNWVWIGAAVVVGSGLYLLHQETRSRGSRRREAESRRREQLLPAPDDAGPARDRSPS